MIRGSFVVLAGGGSRRMGEPKAFLRIGERELLQRVLETGRSCCSDLVLVGDGSPRCLEALARYGWSPASDVPDPASPAPPALQRYRREASTLRIVGDRRPGGGPLAGVEAGLAAARRPHCFVTGCDFPFVEPALVRRMLGELAAWRGEQRAGGEGTGGDPSGPAAVVIRAGGRLQPLCAAYTRSVHRVAARRLDRGRPRLMELLDDLRVRVLETSDVAEDPEAAERWLLDVDDPAALERARRMAGTSEGGHGGVDDK